MSRIFHVIIQQDEDGIYVGKVPELVGCLSQGVTLDELMKNTKEAVELCLEVQEAEQPPPHLYFHFLNTPICAMPPGIQLSTKRASMARPIDFR